MPSGLCFSLRWFFHLSSIFFRYAVGRFAQKRQEAAEAVTDGSPSKKGPVWAFRPDQLLRAGGGSRQKLGAAWATRPGCTETLRGVLFSWKHKFCRWTHLPRVLKCLKRKLPAVSAKTDCRPREPGCFAQAVRSFKGVRFTFGNISSKN